MSNKTNGHEVRTRIAAKVWPTTPSVETQVWTRSNPLPGSHNTCWAERVLVLTHHVYWLLRAALFTMSQRRLTQKGSDNPRREPQFSHQILLYTLSKQYKNCLQTQVVTGFRAGHCHMTYSRYRYSRAISVCARAYESSPYKDDNYVPMYISHLSILVLSRCVCTCIRVVPVQRR